MVSLSVRSDSGQRGNTAKPQPKVAQRRHKNRPRWPVTDLQETNHASRLQNRTVNKKGQEERAANIPSSTAAAEARREGGASRRTARHSPSNVSPISRASSQLPRSAGSFPPPPKKLWGASEVSWVGGVASKTARGVATHWAGVQPAKRGPRLLAGSVLGGDSLCSPTRCFMGLGFPFLWRFVGHFHYSIFHRPWVAGFRREQ